MRSYSIPPTHAADTVVASHAKRNAIVRAGNTRAGGFPPGLSVRSSNRARSPAQPFRLFVLRPWRGLMLA